MVTSAQKLIWFPRYMLMLLMTSSEEVSCRCRWLLLPTASPVMLIYVHLPGKIKAKEDSEYQKQIGWRKKVVRAKEEMETLWPICVRSHEKQDIPTYFFIISVCYFFFFVDQISVEFPSSKCVGECNKISVWLRWEVMCISLYGWRVCIYL